MSGPRRSRRRQQCIHAYRPMQVEEPFGLTTSFLNWLQSGVEAGGGNLASQLFIMSLLEAPRKFPVFSKKKSLSCSDLRKPSCEGMGGRRAQLHTCAPCQERLFVLHNFPARRQARCRYENVYVKSHHGCNFAYPRQAVSLEERLWRRNARKQKAVGHSLAHVSTIHV